MTLIAAVQMASTKDIKQNIDMACDSIEQAALAGAKMAVLPEEFVSLLLTPEEKRAITERYLEGPIQKALADAAKKNNIWVVGGTIPLESTEKNKIFSSCLVWDNQGKCQARYNKIHLFDVTVASGESYNESERLTGGQTVTVFDTPFGRVGTAICYDLRFPELFRLLMLKGADIIVVPSAFTYNTGKVHWEVLLKARAIENLCYIVAPNQVAVRLSGHRTYGHSMIVGPWGDVLGCLPENPGLIMADIDLAKMKQIRQNFPAHTHSRHFLIENLAKQSEEVKS